MTDPEYTSDLAALQVKLGRKWQEDTEEFVTHLSDDILNYILSETHKSLWWPAWYKACEIELIERNLLR